MGAGVGAIALGVAVSEAQPEPAAVGMAEQFEGFSATPYRDPVGIWTIGYGSIWVGGDGAQRVTADTRPIDETTARQWLMKEMQRAAQAVAALVKVPLTDNQVAALHDFIFNLGWGNFASSTLLRKLNAGDYAGAADQIDRWDHAGGKVLAGLLRRRQAETDLFNSGTNA